ncbi:MAG: hypothetical protein ACXWC0_21285 [Burkholderiales bacterium]
MVDVLRDVRRRAAENDAPDRDADEREPHDYRDARNRDRDTEEIDALCPDAGNGQRPAECLEVLRSFRPLRFFRDCAFAFFAIVVLSGIRLKLRCEEHEEMFPCFLGSRRPDHSW